MEFLGHHSKNFAIYFLLILLPVLAISINSVSGQTTPELSCGTCAVNSECVCTVTNCETIQNLLVASGSPIDKGFTSVSTATGIAFTPKTEGTVKILAFCGSQIATKDVIIGAQEKTVQIQVYKGKNYISSPFDPATIETTCNFYQSDFPDTPVISYYDTSSGKFINADSLNNMKPGYAYRVYVSANCIITFKGTNYVKTEQLPELTTVPPGGVDTYKGWNIIGAPGSETNFPAITGTCKSNIEGKDSWIGPSLYNNHLKIVGGEVLMTKPGYAYAFFVKEKCRLSTTGEVPIEVATTQKPSTCGTCNALKFLGSIATGESTQPYETCSLSKTANSDYFKLRTSKTGTVTVTMTTDNNGNLDMRVYSQCSDTSTDKYLSCNSYGTTTSCSFSAEANKDYFVHVYWIEGTGTYSANIKAELKGECTVNADCKAKDSDGDDPLKLGSCTAYECDTATNKCKIKAGYPLDDGCTDKTKLSEYIVHPTYANLCQSKEYNCNDYCKTKGYNSGSCNIENKVCACS